MELAEFSLLLSLIVAGNIFFWFWIDLKIKPIEKKLDKYILLDQKISEDDPTVMFADLYHQIKTLELEILDVKKQVSEAHPHEIATEKQE